MSETERLRQLMAKMADVLRNHQMDLGYDWNYYGEMNEDVVEVLAEYDAWLLSRDPGSVPASR